MTREEAIKHIEDIRASALENLGAKYAFGCEGHYITNRFTMPPPGGIRFCPMCGAPMTDEAVEMVMKRLGAMGG